MALVYGTTLSGTVLQWDDIVARGAGTLSAVQKVANVNAGTTGDGVTISWSTKTVDGALSALASGIVAADLAFSGAAKVDRDNKATLMASYRTAQSSSLKTEYNRLHGVNKAAYIAADTALSTSLETEYNRLHAVEVAARIAADAVVTAAHVAADTALSTSLETEYNRLHAVGQAYVDSQISGLVDGAPGLLNTLNELAAAMDDDENHATTLTNLVAAEATTARAAEVANAALVAGVSASIDSHEAAFGNLVSSAGAWLGHSGTNYINTAGGVNTFRKVHASLDSYLKATTDAQALNTARLLAGSKYLSCGSSSAGNVATDGFTLNFGANTPQIKLILNAGTGRVDMVLSKYTG